MKVKKQTAAWITMFILSISVSSVVHAQMNDTKMPDHVMVLPSDIKWMTDANPAFLPGMKMAVIDGDPSSKGPFTIRIMLPDGYMVMPHFHPTDENITVLKGMFTMGIGDKFDESALKEMPEGSYMSMKTGTHHFAMSKGESIIQVHGMGPFTLTYVNPDDDPRNKKQ